MYAATAEWRRRIRRSVQRMTATSDAAAFLEGTVIRIDILAGSPVFLAGRVRTLTEAGIKIVAVRTCPQEEPSWLADAVLIDVDALPPADALAHVSQTARCTPVLVLDNQPADQCGGYLRAGAAGVVSKRETAERILGAVRAVTSGDAVCPAEGGHLTMVERADAPGGHLSDREDQVLQQISRSLAHGQIATRLGISPHTVDTYVKRIRAKLGVGNKAELTCIALLGRLVDAAQAPATRRIRSSAAARLCCRGRPARLRRPGRRRPVEGWTPRRRRIHRRRIRADG
jgi:DNA-binding NarL/FixJ family response regulator